MSYDAAEYQRNRYHRRLQLAKKALGGSCERCGSNEGLEFDHIDPGSKLFNVTEATNLSSGRFWREVHKCQLLCEDCHNERDSELGLNSSPGEQNGRSKLKPRHVRAIRRLAPHDGFSHRMLADLFGVTKTAITDIVNRNRWTHI